MNSLRLWWVKYQLSRNEAYRREMEAGYAREMRLIAESDQRLYEELQEAQLNERLRRVV
jgi:hypothetical protein